MVFTEILWLLGEVYEVTLLSVGAVVVATGVLVGIATLIAGEVAEECRRRIRDAGEDDRL